MAKIVKLSGERFYINKHTVMGSDGSHVIQKDDGSFLSFDELEPYIPAGGIKALKLLVNDKDFIATSKSVSAIS